LPLQTVKPGYGPERESQAHDPPYNSSRGSLLD